MEIKNLFDYAIRLYRCNFSPMFLAMAMVQLPFSLLTIPLALKLIELANEVNTLQISGQIPDLNWGMDKLEDGMIVIGIMIVAFFYQVLITPLGNLACAWIARQALLGKPASFAAAIQHARQRYWPTQVAIAIFVLPLLAVSIICLMPVLAFQTAGDETGIIASALFALTMIWLAMIATPLFFPRFFMAVNGVIQSEEEAEGSGIFAQGLWYLKRSYGLSRGYYLRLTGLLLLMYFAVYFISQGISETVNIVVSLVQAALAGGEMGNEIFNALQNQDMFSVGLVMTITILFTLIILPVWQSLKTLLYFDLRCRREAYDLKLLLDGQEPVQ